MPPIFTPAPLNCRGVFFLPLSADALPHLCDSLAVFTGWLPHLLPHSLIAPVSAAFQGFSPLYHPSSPLTPGIISLIFYSSAEEAVFKALGVE